MMRDNRMYTRACMVLGGLCGLAVLVSLGCCELAGPKFLDAQHAPTGPGWKSLFNGKDLTGWKSRTPKQPMSWKVVDGVLVNTSSHDNRGVYIVSEEKFGDFEIYYEYKCPPAGNSGVFLRGRYEVQICDDAGKPDYKDTWLNGGLFDVLAPPKGVTRPAGQWQSVYAKMVGKTLTVVLNGTTIIDNYETTGPTRGAMDRNVDAPGPMMLQGDHSSIEMRNLFIRPL